MLRSCFYYQQQPNYFSEQLSHPNLIFPIEYCAVRRNDITLQCEETQDSGQEGLTHFTMPKTTVTAFRQVVYLSIPRAINPP